MLIWAWLIHAIFAATSGILGILFLLWAVACLVILGLGPDDGPGGEQ